MRLSEDEKAAIRHYLCGHPGHIRRLVAPPGWPETAPLPGKAADRAMHLCFLADRAEEIALARWRRRHATRAEFV